MPGLAFHGILAVCREIGFQEDHSDLTSLLANSRPSKPCAAPVMIRASADVVVPLTENTAVLTPCADGSQNFSKQFLSGGRLLEAVSN